MLEAKVAVTNLVGFRGHAENQQETNRTSTMLVIMMGMLLLLMMALPATPFSGSATPRCTACVDNIKQRRKKLLSGRAGKDRRQAGATETKRNDMDARRLHHLHQAAYVGIGIGVGVGGASDGNVCVRCSSIKSSRSLSGLTAGHQQHVVPQHKTQNAKYAHSQRANTHTHIDVHTTRQTVAGEERVCEREKESDGRHL